MALLPHIISLLICKIMAKFEIERKYLVTDDSYKAMADSHFPIAQGYLCRTPERTVRIRIKGERGFITVKGITTGFRREEYEYEIPVDDARDMLRICEGDVVEKIRWIVPFEGFTWEVDEFAGEIAGLTVAELELPSEDSSFPLPSFIGAEVSGDPRYYNSNIVAAFRGKL